MYMLPSLLRLLATQNLVVEMELDMLTTKYYSARISLTSVADIRYKGILMGINHAESTIQLSDGV